MAYTRNIEKLRERLAKQEREKRLKAEIHEQRKARVMKRRKLYAELFEPHPCKESLPNGEPCTRFAIPGGFVCLVHGGDNKSIREAAKTRLLMLVEPALRVIRRCMASGDEGIALKAAMTILDRSGYKDVIAAEEAPEDLSKVSKAQLFERAQAAMQRIRELDQEAQNQTVPQDSFPPDNGTIQ